MSNGHDEVARQIIAQHMGEYEKHMQRIEGMFKDVSRSIRRLHERWDRLLWTAAGSSIVTVGALITYIWMEAQ